MTEPLARLTPEHQAVLARAGSLASLGSRALSPEERAACEAMTLVVHDEVRKALDRRAPRRHRPAAGATP